MNQKIFGPLSAEEMVGRLKNWVAKYRPHTPFPLIAKELGIPLDRFKKAMRGKDLLSGFKWEILDTLISGGSQGSQEEASGHERVLADVLLTRREPKKFSAEELDRIRVFQMGVIENISEPVFCMITGSEISPHRCLMIQGQPECFGCAAPSRFCANCRMRPVAFPEIDLCGYCLRKGLRSENELGLPSFPKEARVQCPLADGKVISVATCRSLQGPQCTTCPSPSRICVSCKSKPVRYPDYGLCLNCAVKEYGGGWTEASAREDESVLNIQAAMVGPKIVRLPVPSRRRSKKHGITYLTPQQMSRFFAAVTDIRDKAIFTVMYHYGLRVSEVSLIQLADVDIANRRIFIRRLDNGISGEHLLFHNTAQILRAYLEVRTPKGSALFTSRQRGSLHDHRIQQLFQYYLKKARLPEDCSVRTLRQSTVVHLLEAGLEMEFIKEHVGFVNIQSVWRYVDLANINRERRLKACDSLNWLKEVLG